MLPCRICIINNFWESQRTHQSQDPTLSSLTPKTAGILETMARRILCGSAHKSGARIETLASSTLFNSKDAHEKDPQLIETAMWSCGPIVIALGVGAPATLPFQVLCMKKRAIRPGLCRCWPGAMPCKHKGPVS